MPSTNNRSIRAGTAGVIVQDVKVLIVKFDDENGPHYNCPDGGHKERETLRQAAAPEVKEETDVDVDIGQLLVVVESAPFEVYYIDGSTHFQKSFFGCKLRAGSVPRLPDKPDANEVTAEWLSLDELNQHPVIPGVSKQLTAVLNGQDPVYVQDDGDIAQLLKEQK